MFKRLLSKIFPSLGASRVDTAMPYAKSHPVDSEDILYSVPTICSPGPAIDALPSPEESRWLDEDDWRQIEFVAQKNLLHIERELATLLGFKLEHQCGRGWTDIYTRSEHPTPLAEAGLRFTSLPTLSVTPLVVGNGPPWGGTVRGGFALSDGGEWFVYGQRDDDGVIQLAVSSGRSVPSDQFAYALSEIAKSSRLLLVDWLAGLVVDTSSSASILAWARRYCGG